MLVLNQLIFPVTFQSLCIMEDQKVVYLVQSIEVGHGGNGVGDWITVEKLVRTLDQAKEMMDEFEADISRQYVWPDELVVESRTNMQVHLRDGSYSTHILIHIQPIDFPSF